MTLSDSLLLISTMLEKEGKLTLAHDVETALERITELEKENKELQECFDECYEELRLTRDAVEFAPRSCGPKEKE